jgi:hypothetical protein
VTGQHRLAPTRRWDDWVNEHGEPRPPLFRAPRWVLRLWAGIDHARYLHRYGHAGPSDGRLHAFYRGAGKGTAGGHGTGQESETVRAEDRPELLWRRHETQR